MASNHILSVISNDKIDILTAMHVLSNVSKKHDERILSTNALNVSNLDSVFISATLNKPLYVKKGNLLFDVENRIPRNFSIMSLKDEHTVMIDDEDVKLKETYSINILTSARLEDDLDMNLLYKEFVDELVKLLDNKNIVAIVRNDQIDPDNHNVIYGDIETIIKGV